jgi:hypothetical protein
MSENTFSTLNVYLASFLEINGFPHRITEGHDGKRLFTFADSEQLRRSLADFAEGAEVKANRFIEHIKLCKTSLYNNRT